MVSKKIRNTNKRNGRKKIFFSCTEGLFGRSRFDKNKKYKKYNTEEYYNLLRIIFSRKNKDYLKDGFPEIWNQDFQRTRVIKKSIDYIYEHNYHSISDSLFKSIVIISRRLDHTTELNSISNPGYYQEIEKDKSNNNLLDSNKTLKSTILLPETLQIGDFICWNK